VHQFAKSWEEYSGVSLWVQHASRSGKQTREEEFRRLYTYLRATGLQFQSIAYVTNVTHAERAALENETLAFMEEFYPAYPYRGFTRPENGTLLPHGEEPQPFYFPAHFVEPIEDKLLSVDVDLYVSPHVDVAVKQAVALRRPVLSEPIPYSTLSSSVAIVNPGIPDGTGMAPRDLSMIAVQIQSLLTFILSSHISIEEPVSVYLYDSTSPDTEAVFLGAATLSEFTGGIQNHGTHIHDTVQIIHDTVQIHDDEIKGGNGAAKSEAQPPLNFKEKNGY
jgi:hypothetical protein